MLNICTQKHVIKIVHAVQLISARYKHFSARYKIVHRGTNIFNLYKNAFVQANSNLVIIRGKSHYKEHPSDSMVTAVCSDTPGTKRKKCI